MNRTARLTLGAALLGAVALGVASAQPAPPLPAPVAGEERSLTLEGFGRVAYFADPRGSGRPLILTVSVNAAASGYEMRPLWDAYAGQRPMYLLEWPGFGHSARPDVPYTPELMTRALTALVAQLGQEADVVALSLGSEFAARAALQEPRIRSLALISPSGLGTPRGASQQGAGRPSSGWLRTLGEPLYALIRTRPSIGYFLGRSFRGPVPRDLTNYGVATSRQPGARFAPLAFIGGTLFTPDAYGELYSRLRQPVLVLYDRDGFVSFERLPDFATRPGVSAVRIPETDGLPHFEKLPEVRAALDTFWQGLER